MTKVKDDASRDSTRGPATIVPAFNPAEYAVDAERRERMPTITDEAALEQARVQSLPSNLPPPRRPMSTVPGPITAANLRDSFVEIDAGETDVEGLGDDDQIALLSASLAPLTRVPILAKSKKELAEALGEPKVAYITGFVDGILPLETIIDVAGLPELETLRVLEHLVAHGLITFRAG